MDPSDLVARLEGGDSPVILDVRSGWEFGRGRIPGAVRVPFWRVSRHLNLIPVRRDDEIVVYCGYGPRAAWAAAMLKRAGFSRVSLLRGHWARWRREKRPRTP